MHFSQRPFGPLLRSYRVLWLFFHSLYWRLACCHMCPQHRLQLCCHCCQCHWPHTSSSSLFLLLFLFIFSHISKERQTNITLDSYPWFPMCSWLCSSYVAVVVNIADCMNYSSLFLYCLSLVFLNFYSNLYPHLHNDNPNCTKTM